MTPILFRFSQLTNQQLYAILQLRQRVFVQEQQSIYDDIDGLDQDALHWCMFENEQLIGYARSRYTTSQKTIQIERVVNHRQYRGKGLGKLLIQTILADKLSFPDAKKVVLSAQVSALSFYRELGFTEYGDTYDDGGIMHQSMQRILSSFSED